MPDLPSGTVTFLFTDIEGSTERWEQDRPLMAQVIERHIALLDAAVEAHGGVHFKTVGDAVQVAFPTAPQAVAAAVDGQRALLTEDWGKVGPLKVRMAIHAGEAIPDARGDYLAAPLNRLSRLLSTGYGSQILVSQTVQQLTRSALPAGAELRDLGEHRLRDLLDPERVFQLLHPDLPTDFPPLKSLENRPNNLPRQPTPFLGREREVAAVVGLLRKDDIQLLTLVGPGGTGKTRLALQAAAELLDDFPDGVFVVPLASVTDSALVPSTIAGVLGIREEGERSVIDRLRDALALKQLLVVLDNFEHLAEAAPLVGELLAGAPGLKALATSRVPLRLRAEREFPVPPLGLPRRKPPPTLEQLSQYEAVRLFIDRAQAVKPTFAVDNANAPAIAEICHRLDGLPLAIELAAARVRMLPPQALLARLEQRLPLLSGGARDAPARQQTLRNTIAWSYDLLEPEKQGLFQRLAIFAGGMTFDAVEAVANVDGRLDVFGGLERLLEHSLLRQEEGLKGEPRFTMLETIHEFGLEQLATNRESEEVRRYHTKYFLALAKQAHAEVRGPEQELWLARLETEHDNLQAALTWLQDDNVEEALQLAEALFWLWMLHGHLEAGRRLLEGVLARSEGIVSIQHAKVLNAAGKLAQDQGDHARTEEYSGKALQILRELGDTADLPYTLLVLGGTAVLQGDHERARLLLEEALSLCHANGDDWGQATVLGNLAAIAADQGAYENAIQLVQEELELYRKLGDQVAVAHALRSLGWLTLVQGSDARAAAFFNQVIEGPRTLGHRRAVTDSIQGLGVVARRAGDLGRAADLLNEALVAAQELEDPALVASCLTELGNVFREQGNVEHAARYYRESLLVSRDSPDDVGVAETLVSLTGLAAEAAHFTSTPRLIGAADALRESINARRAPIEQTAYERVTVATRDYVGDARYMEQVAEGRLLGREQAITAGLAVASALSSSSSQVVSDSGAQLDECPAVAEGDSKSHDGGDGTWV